MYFLRSSWEIGDCCESDLTFTMSTLLRLCLDISICFEVMASSASCIWEACKGEMIKRDTNCWGWLLTWDCTTKSANWRSRSGSTVSLTTQRISKLSLRPCVEEDSAYRDKMASVRSTFCMKETAESYRPRIGFATLRRDDWWGSYLRRWQNTELEAASRYRPVMSRGDMRCGRRTFEMLILCCSIASWMDVRSLSFILSNSYGKRNSDFLDVGGKREWPSIMQTPLSAKTKAPPSNVHSRVSGSFLTAAVSPTALHQVWYREQHVQMHRDLSYTQLDRRFSRHTSKIEIWQCLCVNATPRTSEGGPGSPSNNTFKSPRILCFCRVSFPSPPNSARAIPLSE